MSRTGLRDPDPAHSANLLCAPTLPPASASVECLSARLEVIIRSHMRLPLEGHVGELLNKFRRDKARPPSAAPLLLLRPRDAGDRAEAPPP